MVDKAGAADLNIGRGAELASSAINPAVSNRLPEPDVKAERNLIMSLPMHTM